MKTTLLLATSLSLLPGFLFAADLYPPEQMPYYVPESPPMLSWAGLYEGVQLGYQWGRSTQTTQNSGSNIILQQPAYSDQGVVGGAHVGYNWQASQFVYGVEGDIEGSSYNGAGQSLGTIRLATHETIMGSLRARAGYAWNRILLYGTGGLAVGSYRNGASVGGGAVSQSDETLRAGWTLGAGAEYAINNTVSVRAEYRYTDSGHYSEYALVGTVNHHQTDNRVEAGVSFKFGGFEPPRPVYARY